MPNVAGGPLVFHPSYCFKHSKTYNTWARLSVTTVLELKTRSGFEGQNLYFLLNHPIRWVRLVGLIVAFDVYPNRVVMTLDDSSGSTIEIYCKKDPIKKPVVDTTVDSNGAIQLNGQADLSVDHEHTCITNEGYTVNLKGIDVGSVVKVKGGVSEFRGEKQITLERISVIGTTNEEASAWTENAAFYSNTLSEPWIVSESLRREAKREALGLDGEKEAKEKRRRTRRKEREEKLQRNAKKHEEHPTGKRRQAPKRNHESSEADQAWHKKEVNRSANAQNVG